MAEPTKTIWKLNKILSGVIILVLLLTALGLGGVFGYQKLKPVVLKDAYNKKCSTTYDGCGKYGANSECNVLGAYDSVYKQKVYTTRGTVDYLRYRDGGQLQWFCNENEAKTAGYANASEYCGSGKYGNCND